MCTTGACDLFDSKQNILCMDSDRLNYIRPIHLAKKFLEINPSVFSVIPEKY